MPTLNSPITDLDMPQVIQREFDVANDAQRVSVINSVPIPTSNLSVGPNGATAPVDSTEIAGVNGGGNLTPVSVDNSGNINVNVLSSVTPTGIATSANQATEITALGAINTATAALNLRTPGGFVTKSFDETVVTYVGSTTNISTVTYKLLGVTQNTLTMSYDGSNRLIDVVKT